MACTGTFPRLRHTVTGAKLSISQPEKERLPSSTPECWPFGLCTLLNAGWCLIGASSVSGSKAGCSFFFQATMGLFLCLVHPQSAQGPIKPLPFEHPLFIDRLHYILHV